MNKAREEKNDSKRFVLYAQAEAMLLESAVMIPTTTQGGAYTISRESSADAESFPSVLSDLNPARGLAAVGAALTDGSIIEGL